LNAAAGNGLPSPFPWEAVMHAGLCLLRLPAAVFWSMTPREMQAALGDLKPAAPVPSRSGLEMLMAGFPD
jgi:uncharacterized phage protein (TIGR02216 family)